MIIVTRVTFSLKNSFHLILLYPSSVHRFDKIIILTLATARPNRDEGEVGHQQNLWLEEKLRNEQCKYMTIRIIAMHHHLGGVLDTGTDKIVIVDAGDILRTCLHHDVDLVLCGHKHRAWLWNLETMDIVYAGTASSTRFRGFPKNTYNSLDIKSNGKVSFDLKIVGGERIPLANLARKQKGKLEI